MANFLDSGQLSVVAGSQANAKVDLPTLIGRIVQVGMDILGVLLLIYLLYAGFLWMTAGGDETQVKKSKEMIKNAVIGLLIVAAAFAITSFVIKNLAAVAS